MNAIAAIDQIVMLLIIAAIGLWLRHAGIFTDGVIKGVNTTVLKVAWPAMVLSTTQKNCTPQALRGFCLVAAVTAAVLAAMCLVIKVVCAARGSACGAVFTVLAVMPNAGFVGLPLIQAVYGDPGVLYLAAFLMGFNLVLWTVGVSLFARPGSRSLAELFNPGVVSAVVGTAFFVLHVALPTPLLSSVNQLGGLTTPLSMLLLGARLRQVRPGDLKQARLWIAAGIKLLLMPVIALVVMRLLKASEILTGVTVMAMAMPAASAVQMLAEKYYGDVMLSVQGVSVTMLLSTVTIPLILLIFGL